LTEYLGSVEVNLRLRVKVTASLAQIRQARALNQKVRVWLIDGARFIELIFLPPLTDSPRDIAGNKFFRVNADGRNGRLVYDHFAHSWYLLELEKDKAELPKPTIPMTQATDYPSARTSYLPNRIGEYVLSGGIYTNYDEVVYRAKGHTFTPRNIVLL
jgi:hypothetical protein